MLWILTVSADGAVPVHFKLDDGNTEDSTTHMETWEVLRRLVGSANFLYVADSKLCTRDNLQRIEREKGSFITVLPRTRKEDGLFRDWLQQNTPSWQEVVRKPHPRLRYGPPDIFRALSSPIPDADGFRVIWYHSSHKMERDAQFRSDAIQSAWKALEALPARVEGPRSRFRTRASVAAAMERIVADAGAERWVACEFDSVQEPSFQQEKRGRPGTETRWRRRLKTRFRVRWTLRQEQIAYDSHCDGIFPLITNRKDLSLDQILEIYKSKQPLVEKRHDLLKNVQAATPMYLKSVSRIEALLFLHFVALLVHALIERQIRRAMKTREISDLPLYPEERDCKAPSTDRILDVFAPIQRHLLRKEGRLVERFDPELNDLQRGILGLLGISQQLFVNL